MCKRILLLFAAVTLFIMANTRLGCMVRVEGQNVNGVFSLLEVFEGEKAAICALDEIIEGETLVPTLKKHYRLCIKSPEGVVEQLSHRIITASNQAALLHRVSIREEKLGYVECGAVLKERLHQYAYSHMPPLAESCRLSRELTIQPVYCRSSQKWGYEEMLNEIFEVSPLIYSA